MKNKKNIIIGILAVVTIGYCSTAASYLESGVSARTDAMGRAFSAVANDLDAFYYNPAGYGFQDKLRANTMFTKVSNMNSYYYLGAGGNYFNGYAALNLCMTTLDGIPETSYENVNGTMMPVETGKTFSYDSKALFFSYAFGLKQLFSGMEADNIKLGFNAKYIGESLYDNSSSGFGLDAGIMYKQDALAVGLSVMNLIEPMMSWDTDSGEKNTVERTERLGVAYQFNDKLLLSADILLKKNSQVFGLGAEYMLAEFFALRGGLMTGGYSVGLGVLYTDFNFDYAYIIPSDDLIDHTQKVSLGYVFSQLPIYIKQAEDVPVVDKKPEPQPEKSSAPQEEQPTVSIPAAEAPAVSTENVKPLSEIFLLQKKSVVLGEVKAKGFYVFKNTGNKDITVKVNSMLIGPAGNVLASEVKEAIVAGAQQDIIIEQIISSAAVLKPGSYKIKTFIGTQTETITFVDTAVK